MRVQLLLSYLLSRLRAAGLIICEEISPGSSNLYTSSVNHISNTNAFCPYTKKKKRQKLFLFCGLRT